MPFQVRKIKDKYRLYNLDKKKYVNVNYKTKQSALNAAKTLMRYSYAKK